MKGGKLFNFVVPAANYIYFFVLHFISLYNIKLSLIFESVILFLDHVETQGNSDVKGRMKVTASLINVNVTKTCVTVKTALVSLLLQPRPQMVHILSRLINLWQQ